jgi:flagellar biosynthesis protein FliP
VARRWGNLPGILHARRLAIAGLLVAAAVVGPVTIAYAGQQPSVVTVAAPGAATSGWVAAPTPSPVPSPASVPAVPSPGDLSVSVGGGDRNQAISIIILMTVLSVAPAILLMTTAFTKIAVVLSLTRNALGTPTIPPNQVLAGLALFLSIFVMSPVLSDINDVAITPYRQTQISQERAIERAQVPLKKFMLAQTGPTELQTMIKLSREEAPKTRDDVSMTTLIPAFVLSELKAAFIIGFVIFLPFLIIDLVVGSALMSMGMMMLPPIMISLPFKLLLFVMVDGWNLITTALVSSYR